MIKFNRIVVAIEHLSPHEFSIWKAPNVDEIQHINKDSTGLILKLNLKEVFDKFIAAQLTTESLFYRQR